MQQFIDQRRNRLRMGAIALAFLVLATVVAVQWLIKSAPDDVTERIVERERVPLFTRAELHWQSMLLGERDAFLAGLSDDVLFVVQPAPYRDSTGDSGLGRVKEPIVLNGLSAVADAYDSGVLKPLRARSAVVTFIEQTEDRVVGTVLSEVQTEGVEDNVRVFEFTATVRINLKGRVFEERLEISYMAEVAESVLNK